MSIVMKVPPAWVVAGCGVMTRSVAIGRAAVEAVKERRQGGTFKFIIRVDTSARTRAR